MMLKKLTFHSFRNLFPILLFTIVIGLGVNILCFRMEYTQLVQSLEETDQKSSELKWEFIKAVAQEDYLAAGADAKIMAINIDHELKLRYPDEMVLVKQMDSGDPKAEYIKVFKENIRGHYFNGIKNDHNDAFVADRDGVLLDMSLNFQPTKMPVKWSDHWQLHYNKELAANTINLIIAKDNSMLFWEYLPSDNPDHYMVTKPDMDELRELYMREGLEGLKNIEFFAPAYITENGDIFGVEDFDNSGNHVENHKIIVVQGFNLYDQIMDRHAAEIERYDAVSESIHSSIANTMTMRTVSIIVSTFIILTVVVLLMVFNNKVFHEDGFCPFNREDNISDTK